MKHYFEVKADGVSYGKFAKEEWADEFAALLIKRGFDHVEVDIQCFIVSNDNEFKNHLKSWNN